MDSRTSVYKSDSGIRRPRFEDFFKNVQFSVRVDAGVGVLDVGY
jgi:hypothetical protein